MLVYATFTTAMKNIKWMWKKKCQAHQETIFLSDPPTIQWTGPTGTVVSLTFCELSKIISRKYTKPEMTFMVRISSETLYVCPKHDFWHMYKVSAWNLHRSKISAIHKFRENILESSGNVSETTPTLEGRRFLKWQPPAVGTTLTMIYPRLPAKKKKWNVL